MLLLTQDRPREKLLLQGSQALTDSELLAIFYRVGIKGKPVLKLADEHLAQAGSLKSLLDTSYTEAQALSGMGLTKFVSLQAGLELGKRYLAHTFKARPLFSNLPSVLDYLRLQMRGYADEVLVGLFLDIKNGFLGFAELAKGGLSSAQLYPRPLVRQALNYNAAGLIVAHNHLSGDPAPSQADKLLTATLKELLEKIEVRLLDHIILGEGRYFSFAEQGYL